MEKITITFKAEGDGSSQTMEGFATIGLGDTLIKLFKNRGDIKPSFYIPVSEIGIIKIQKEEL